MHPARVTTVYSALSNVVNLTLTARANPPPTMINCSTPGLNGEQFAIISVYGDQLAVGMTSLPQDIFEYAVLVDVNGQSTYGEYVCRMWNDVGFLQVSYMVKPDGNKHTIVNAIYR